MLNFFIYLTSELIYIITDSATRLQYPIDGTWSLGINQPTHDRSWVMNILSLLNDTSYASLHRYRKRGV